MRREPGGRDGFGRRVRVGTALVALVVSAGACSPLDDVMVAIFGRSMRSSVSFDPYENPRLPAEGAVPFASSNYPSAPGVVNLGEPDGLEEDIPPLSAADMGAPGSDRVNAIENPVPADSASLARGQVMYERMCAVCHGVDGYSAGSRMVRDIAGMQLMTQFDLADGNAVGFSDGYLYGMIRVGRGLMPAYGHRVTHFDRWHIVNYVRELQRRAGQLQQPGEAEGAEGAPAAGAGEGS